MGEEFNDEITEDDLTDLINRTNKAESKVVELSTALSSVQQSSRDDNFLHHQVSTEKMIEQLEHFYAGDFRGVDGEGNEVWKKQKNKELITFNEFGVTSLMEIITKYIDKNTILSKYNQERIYEILGQLGDELVLFILCNYEKIGMDTHFKKTKFRLIVVTTLHTIESTYRRSIGGTTLEELNQSKVVGQFGKVTSPQQQHIKRPSSGFSRIFPHR